MAKLDKVAHRYARALYGLYSDTKKAAPMISELRRVAELIAENQDLKRLATSRIFSTEKTTEVMAEIGKKLKLSPAGLQILKVIAEMKRLQCLAQIVDKWEEFCLTESGVVSLKVEAALPVAEKERKQLETKFESILGKKVQAKYELNGSLVGGVRVQAGSRTFDGSIHGWLAALNEKLIEGSR